MLKSGNMAFRVFLNTDVLLDFTLKGRGYDRSRKLMALAVNGRLQTFITTAVLQDTGRRLRQAYGAERTKELLLALLAEVSVIDGSHTVTVSALHSTMGDREEAISYYTALYHKLDYFLTEDMELANTAVPMLPVVTPEAFLKNNH